MKFTWPKSRFDIAYDKWREEVANSGRNPMTERLCQEMLKEAEYR